MKQTLKGKPVAGYRITENEQQKLEQAKETLGLKSISETMRYFVKQGIDKTLRNNK